MSMSKKDFILLADIIRTWNKGLDTSSVSRFTPEQIERLADFCRATNSNFNRDRWLDYIAGHCGPNGGVK